MEEIEMTGFWFIVGKLCYFVSVGVPLLFAAFFCFCLLAAAWQGLAAVVKKVVRAVRRNKNKKNKKNKNKKVVEKVYKNGKIFTIWGH